MRRIKIILGLSVVLLLSAAAIGDVLNLSRTVSDGDLVKLFTEKKLQNDHWYTFAYFPEQKIQLFPNGKVPKKVKQNKSLKIAQLKFKYHIDKITQISFQTYGALCFDRSFLEAIKKFLHVQVDAKMLRKAAIVGLFPKPGECSPLRK